MFVRKGSAARLLSNDAQLVEKPDDRLSRLVTQLRVPHAYVLRVPLVEPSGNLPSLSMTQPRATHAYLLLVRPSLPLTQLRVLLGEPSGNLPSLSTTQPRVTHASMLRWPPVEPPVDSLGESVAQLSQWPALAHETV